MKLKLLSTIALTIAITAGLWLWLHRTVPTPRSLPVAATPAAAPVPKPFPSNPVKMVTVSSPQQPMVINPSKNAWSDIQTIVSSNEVYHTRFDAINVLPSSLTDDDWEALQPFLLKPDALDAEQLNQVLKNRLLDTLCAMNPPPGGLGDVLTQMYRDYKQNDVIRDYAVQHLAAYYEQLNSPPNANAKARQTIQEVLWGALSETRDSIAGTALLGLLRMSQEDAGIVQNKIATAALQLANDGNAGELSHITAYQVCARMNVQAALPTIEAAAQESPTISQKISAIGALGLLGGTEQVALLNAVLQGDEERLKPAALHALEQIASRH
jgi:hypothetical protein